VEILQELENETLADKILGVIGSEKDRRRVAITPCVDAVLRWP